jgi:transposase
MIKKVSGVAYHEAHVWRLLQGWGWGWGWSCQRPVGRVSQRNEKAIARWKAKVWPQIKKKPAARGEPSTF